MDALLTADTCPECGKPQRWVCRPHPKNRFRSVPTFLRCSAFPKCQWKKMPKGAA